MTAHSLHVSLPPELVDEIAEAVVRKLALRDQHEEDRWMDAREAARYLGFKTVEPIRKLTAAREIPFSQDSPRGKCWFQRSQLDAWRNENGKGPS